MNEKSKDSSKKSILKDIWNNLTHWSENPDKELNKKYSKKDIRLTDEENLHFLYETQAAFEIQNNHKSKTIHAYLEISNFTRFIPEYDTTWTKLLEKEISPSNKAGALTNHTFIGGICRLLISYDDKKISREFEIEHRDSTFTFTFTETEELHFSYRNTIHQDLLISSKY